MRDICWDYALAIILRKRFIKFLVQISYESHFSTETGFYRTLLSKKVCPNIFHRPIDIDRFDYVWIHLESFSYLLLLVPFPFMESQIFLPFPFMESLTLSESQMLSNIFLRKILVSVGPPILFCHFLAGYFEHFSPKILVSFGPPILFSRVTGRRGERVAKN